MKSENPNYPSGEVESDISIREIFYKHTGNLIHKWDHYLDIYSKHLSHYRNNSPVILEIGISHGGSIQLWKKYFGPGCQIYAIDINPECLKFAEENVKIFIGSQSDSDFLSDVVRQIPDLDFVLDDGGHFMDQQSVSFEMLFPKVKQGGQYIVEDTHTSYWPEFGGGLRNISSFIEKSKSLVDSLHQYHLIRKDDVREDDISQNIDSITFYDSMVIFNKKLRLQPFHKQIGRKTITPYEAPVEKRKKTLKERIASLFSRNIPIEHPFTRNDGGITGY